MATLAELQARKTALEKAQFNGTRTVQHGDKSITYRSQAEIDRAMASLNEQITRLQGKRKTRHVRFATGRGL